MDDNKWEDSALQWESAYRAAKADRDKLEVKLQEIKKLAKDVKRGCDCEYDHRCGNCDALIYLLAAIVE